MAQEELYVVVQSPDFIPSKMEAIGRFLTWVSANVTISNDKNQHTKLYLLHTLNCIK